MPGNQLLYKNKKIHYSTYGKGWPVILLHGFGEDGNIWDDLVPELQKKYFLIIPDLPGSGRSEMLDGSASIEDLAEVIKSVIDKEISKLFSTPGEQAAITLIGHSMGGYIALAFAEKYPILLNGFGLFHSSAYADDEQKKQTRRKGIEFIKANGAHAFLKASIPNLFAGKEHHIEMESLIEKGKKFSDDALISYYQAMINRPDRTEVLRKFAKPILFIAGEKDTAIPLQAILEQSHIPAISHFHVLDTGHMGMIEVKNRSKAIIHSFLQNI